jgi:hypothetical protein
MKTENFRLFSANGNVKRKFVFLGRQTINGNRRLLFSKNAHLQYAHDYVQGLPMYIYFSGLWSFGQVPGFWGIFNEDDILPFFPYPPNFYLDLLE